MTEGAGEGNGDGDFSFLRSLPTVIAGTLAALAVIVYPLGLLAYWIQIWRDYTHDATTALYAASLLPPPVAAGNALDLLPTAFVAALVATFASNAFPVLIFRPTPTDTAPEWFTRLIRVVFSNPGRIVIFILGLTPALLVPLVLNLVTLDSATDVFFYACAVTVAAVGGLYQLWLLVQPELETRTADAAIPPNILWQGILALFVPVVLAALLLIPLYSPAFATKRAPAGHRLKILVGEFALFASERRGTGKHQVDALSALLHHPYLNALWQLRPQLLLHGPPRIIK